MRLHYGIMANKGGALLISENAGDGKTSVLRRLVNELENENPGDIRVAFIDHPTLTPLQMIQEMSRQLGECPETIVIFGIEPLRIEPKQQLSKTLSAKLNEYTSSITEELGA